MGIWGKKCEKWEEKYNLLKANKEKYFNEWQNNIVENIRKREEMLEIRENKILEKENTIFFNKLKEILNKK